jgi:hypothetical protein
MKMAGTPALFATYLVHDYNSTRVADGGQTMSDHQGGCPRGGVLQAGQQAVHGVLINQ